MTETNKEMTDFGPVRRLRDSLVSEIHESFTMRADGFLSQGIINQEERIYLSGQISKALNAFNDGMPDDLANRPLDLPPVVPVPNGAVSYMKEAIDKAMGIIDWLAGSKGFDTSAWNGSASQWDTAEAYCSDCLIDENTGGGPKTKDKCHLPYRKPGSNQINKNALRAIGAGARSLTAVQASPASKKKAANWVISNWKSAFGTNAPAGIYKIAGKTPPSTGQKSAVQIFKAANGDRYILLMYSNKYEDRESDILSNESHVEFAKWANESGFKPHITLFHQPVLSKGFWIKVFEKFGDDVPKLNEIINKVYRESGIGIAEAERITTLNGFTFMFGKVYPEKNNVADKLAEMKDLGTSHTFVAMDFTKREKSGMIVNKYRTIEGAVLPRSRAANLLTLSVVQEKAMAKDMKMSDDDRAWLSGVIGEEAVKNLEANTAELEKTFDGILAFKAVAEGDDAPAADPVEPAADPAVDEKAAKKGKMPDDMPPDAETTTDEDVTDKNPKQAKKEAEDKPAEAVSTKELAEAVIKMLNVDELKDVLKTLAEGQTELVKNQTELSKTVAELKKSEDEKIADIFTPLAWKTFQPSQAEPPANQKDLKEKVEKDAPTDPAATTGDSSNPLDVGFWQMIGKPGGLK